nr:MAG TPA: hypothetical protein [Caudoviricetes sp.]
MYPKTPRTKDTNSAKVQRLRNSETQLSSRGTGDAASPDSV